MVLVTSKQGQKNTVSCLKTLSAKIRQFLDTEEWRLPRFRSCVWDLHLQIFHLL